jgi:hypothetical protein
LHRAGFQFIRRAMNEGLAPRVGMVSLGCPKALVDS